MYKLLWRLIVIILLIVSVWWWYVTPETATDSFDSSKEETVVIDTQKDGRHADAEEERQETTTQNTPQYTYDAHVRNSVGFIVQAPQAQWDDERFQDACEEASLLMTARWHDGKGGLSKSDATGALLEMFEREKDFFTPETIDTSAEDTARFGNAYFGEMYHVKKDITLRDIYQALSDGALVIVPTNGQKLGNPHFSGDGPERHMLVITGYDLDQDVFITNDPGTRKGKNYRYNMSTLYNAIRDYPTGHKVPIAEVTKTMIVVQK